MKYRVHSVLVILITVASFLPLRMATGQAGSDEQPAVSLVIQTGTQAVIRRSGWSGFSRLSLGAEVQFGDLLDPKGEPMRILCANLAVAVVTHLGPVPCPRERVILHLDTRAIAGWQRGKSDDTAIPFLISPRATDITTPYPLIWWNAVPGVDGYRVTVRGERQNWSVTLNDPRTNQVMYPKNAPALKPGVAYTVEIVSIIAGADDHSSIEEDVPGLSFSVLAPQDSDDVQKAAANIRANVKDKTLGDLAVAYFYAQRNLKADALQLLAGVSRDVPGLTSPRANRPGSPVSTSPILYLRLGDLYASSRIRLFADQEYRRAAELAEKNGDLETQAVAWMELARLAADKSQQTEYATKAVTIWQQLGAQQQIDAVQQEFNLGNN